jgi:hypothetical protein
MSLGRPMMTRVTRRQLLAGSGLGIATVMLAPQRLVFADVPQFNPIFASIWVSISPSVVLTKRGGASMVYNPRSNQMVMFGGTNIVRGGTGPFVNTGLDGSVKSPQAQLAAASVTSYGTTPQGASTNQTLVFDATGWSVLARPVAPSPRAYAHMAFDLARGNAVLFGGADDYENPLGDMWILDGITGVWSQLNPPTLPPARSRGVMTYDPIAGNVLLFGGLGVAGLLGDTWIWDGSSWSQMNSSGPTPRAGASIAPNPQVVLFGGQDDVGVRGDTWGWSFASGGGSWTQMGTDDGPPGGRIGAALAYSSLVGGVTLFGGSSSPLGPPQNDSWALDPTTDKWVNATTAVQPSPRADAAYATYGDTRGILVVGGTVPDDYASDAWLWATTQPIWIPPIQ